MSFSGWKPYVPAAARRKQAEKSAAKAKKAGTTLSPVPASRGAIARTFWGKGWCDNLERYSDYANRLPRGRTYVRNGAVIDLKITHGEVRAKVVGSRLYAVDVTIAPVPMQQWQSISADCAGSIDSLVELLQGRFATAVMERICRPHTGLFPAPQEIQFSCSCPDWAAMCKHVAAVLYGVGARLDRQPELIFALRRVDPQDLVAQAGAGLRKATPNPSAGKRLDADHLAEVFGIEMADVTPGKKPAAPHPTATAPRTKKATARGTAPDAAVAAGKATTGTTNAAKVAIARKKAKAKVPATKSRNTGTRIGQARLRAMIEEATTDAYGEAEQATGWYTMLDEHVALPFATTVLGAAVNVVRFDLRGDHDIVAICTRGRQRQAVPILDLPLPAPRPVGAEWIEAYRRWSKG